MDPCTMIVLTFAFRAFPTCFSCPWLLVIFLDYVDKKTVVN